MPQPANCWKQQNRSTEGKPWPCSPCPWPRFELAPPVVGQRQEQGLAGLAMGSQGLTGARRACCLCLCAGGGGRHAEVPVKATFFSTRKPQNSVLPLHHRETVESSLFEPVQKLLLYSPSESYQTETFQSLTIGRFALSRTLSCSFVFCSGRGQQNSPRGPMSEVT